MAITASGATPDASSDVAATATAAWSSLNQTLDGRLHAMEPFALPCFSSFEGKPVARNATACAERQAKYTDGLYRRQFPGGYMYDNSVIDASDPTSKDKCILDGTNPSNPAAWEGQDCRLGNLASYWVDVQGADDVAAAFSHARRHGTRLAIKNSGHTFENDASAKNSLLLWTQNLKKRVYHDAWTPEGCGSSDKDAAPQQAVTLGAGIGCGEAYEFADRNNVNVICGYSSTVGITGGWVQNAGHSVMSNTYGLGVDRVLQFKIVTPDGRLRTVNKHRNPDLFWALRGGGGGTFGVVLEATHKVDPVRPIAVAVVGVPKQPTPAKGFMDTLVDTALQLGEDGWGGHIYGNRLIYVDPRFSSQADAQRSMKRVADFAVANGGTANITIQPTFYNFFRDYVLSTGAPVGGLLLGGGGLTQASVFRNATQSAQLKSFIHSLIDKGSYPYMPIDTPYNFKPLHDTAVSPLWYTALWQIGVPGKWHWNDTLADREAAQKEMRRGTQHLTDLGLISSAYKNEAEPFDPNWKSFCFGDNYGKLLAIKNKYDPHRLLRCWHCIGWTNGNAAHSSYRAFV